MASSLAKTIGSDFLTCGVCLESYNDPRALPCHHGFCLECLESCVVSSRDKRTLVCQTCREVVKLSKEGVKGLPVHFLVNSLQDAVEMDKAGTPPDTTSCSNCDGNRKAIVRCIDCRHYLCDKCHVFHRGLKPMKEHRVVSMEDILSGKVDILAEENNICQDHKEPQKYYCQNDKKAICQDCVILKKCPPEHDRITIDQAALEKSEDLEDLVKKGGKILQQYQDSVKEVDVIEKELEILSTVARSALARVEQKYIKLLKKTVKRFNEEIDNIKEERMKELDRKKTSLRSTMKDIEKTNEDVTRVSKSPNKMEVISSHTMLATNLKTFSKSQPNKVGKTLGYIKFEAAIPSILNIGQLLKQGATGEPWELIGQFSTGDYRGLGGLALDQDENIVVCSWFKGVKVFTKNGDTKSTLYDSPGSPDVSVLLGKKYVTAPIGTGTIKICDSQGKQAITCPITDVNDEPSYVNSLTVDCDNKIIVGQNSNTISIHNADGSLISKFATQSELYRLAATSNGEIVGTFRDADYGRSVQLMDYSGCNVRVIHPPDDVRDWSPWYVCCGQGEIFVCNEDYNGDVHVVYRYTLEGDYLGCVTTEVENPEGIALSRDCMELFVADSGDNHIKIFQRQ